MDRNLVLATLVLCVCGWPVYLAALLPLAGPRCASGREEERRLWRRLVMPVLPALVVAALLIGWAAQEPRETDEILRPAAFVCGALMMPIWGRALVRAARALRPGRAQPFPAVTVGLVWPHVMIDPELERRLDQDAVAALRAHEQAHVAHRDPMRIWIAQLAADLQWPAPSAGRRLHAWLSALEVARDEEARAAGIRGEDLASAIMETAKLALGRSGLAAAPLTGIDEGRALAARLDRLFAPVPAAAPTPGGWTRALGLAAAVALALLVGLTHGDTAVRALSVFVTTSD